MKDRIKYTWTRDGALVVNIYSLLVNKEFRRQCEAAIKLGRLKAPVTKR
jgi:hypothetical protein